MRLLGFGCALAIGFLGGFYVSKFSRVPAQPGDRLVHESANQPVPNSRAAAGIATFESHVEALSIADLPQVIDHCLRLKDPLVRHSLLTSYFEQWLKNDAAAALAYLRRKDASMRSELWNFAARAWGKIDFTSAAQFIRENARRGDLADRLILSALNGFAQGNLKAAASAAVKFPYGMLRENAIERIGKTYATVDTRAGLEWARGLPITRGRTRAIEALGLALAAKAPREVIELAQTQGAPDVQQHLLREGFLNWGQLAPADALAFLEKGIKQADARSHLLGVVYKGWAKADPAAAAKSVSSLTDSRAAHEAIIAVASEWGMIDAKATAEWAVSLPDEKAKQAALVFGINNWLDHDPNLAIQWIGKLPDPNLRDYATAVTCGKLAFEFPDLSVEMANAISDGQMRRAALSTIETKWQTLDQATAVRLKTIMKY